MNRLAVAPGKTFRIFLGALFLLLVIISYQVTDPLTGRSVLGNVVFRLLSPFQLLISNTTRGIAGVARAYLDLVQVNRENERLRREVADLRILLATGGHEKAENERLRRIFRLKEKVPYQLLVGEVIGRDAKSGVSETITVNRGSRSGVRPQLPAVTPDGVVGIVIQVDLFTSRILLITGASASIGAMLGSNRVAGILSGKGSGRCTLRFLPLDTSFKKGDLVVTSGQDGIFPEGLPVGRVAAQDRESEFYKSADVTPFQNFSAMDEVVFLTQTGSAPAESSKAAAAQLAGSQGK